MYTEACLFVGNLLQSGAIDKVIFRKKTFKIIWSNKSEARYDYNEQGILEFLEDYEEKTK